MSISFHEVLFDPQMLSAQSATGSPELANSVIKSAATGVYKVNITRYDPQLILQLDLTQVTPTQLEYFNQFWMGGWGSAIGFRLQWPGDFYAVGEVLALLGDGANKIFNLTKSYKRPGSSTIYYRRIIKPVTNSHTGGASVALLESNGSTSRVIPTIRGAQLGILAFTVYINTGAGPVATTAYVIDNTTGIITFTSAPASGAIISWTGEYDTPVRFTANSFSQKVDVSSEITAVQIAEIFGAELGIT